MTFKTQKGIWFLVFFFLWGVFFLAANSFLDPDFGWHLKTGQWILEHQAAPQTDVFSYTMPNFPWRAHSWLAEVVIAGLYPLIGYSGLAFLAGLVMAATLMLIVPRKKISLALVPLLLLSLAVMEFISPRPKLISIFLASLLFLIIRRSYQKTRWLWSFPFIFGAWVNFHGGFLIGLEILGLAILADFLLILKGKKSYLHHFKLALVVSCLSVLATLVNPYGWRIYQEAFLTVSSRNLHGQVAEWLPYGSFNLGMIFYTGLFLPLALIFRKKLSLFEKIGVGFFLIEGLASRRLLIYFFTFSLPLLIDLVESLLKLVAKEERFQLLLKKKAWFWLAFGLFFLSSLVSQLVGFKRLTEEKFYPQKALFYLSQQEITGNLFSAYNWGGYLIWKLPAKKVFLDGRMAIWEQNGYSPFKEWFKIESGEQPFAAVFTKHQVSHVLLPTQEFISVPSGGVLKKKSGPAFNLLAALFEADWHLVYGDEVALVLAKSNEGERWLKIN